MNKLHTFMLYPNAEISDTANGHDAENIADYLTQFQDWVTLEQMIEQLEHHKLILRHIETITDEELTDCFPYDQKKFLVAHLKDNKPLPLKIFDYLRSINIDIDELKEKGLAIYE